MKLTALTTTKIEGDVIEEFVRHTLRFVDRVVIVDNESLDIAREVLTELRSEGLAVDVWAGEAIPSRADGWTAFARRAFATFETDYLLMLDVDEFVRAPSRSSLEESLAALRGAHALVPWVTYLPTPEDDAAEPRVLARIRHRLRAEPRPFSKVFVHRSFMEQTDARILQGNHGVWSGDAGVASLPLAGVQLAHIPVRSPRQIQSKALLGWPTVLAMGYTEEQPVAYQFRRLNERLLNETDFVESEFFQVAWHYLDENDERPDVVLDPLPPVERRYPGEAPELLPLAMAFSRQLARLCGNVRGQNAELETTCAAERAEHRALIETERAAVQGLAEERSRLDARFESGRARARTELEAERTERQHLEGRAALLEQARDQAEAQANVHAKRCAEALDHLANATLRYQAELQEIQGVITSMRQSRSWRLTLPMRLTAGALRSVLHRIKTQSGGDNPSTNAAQRTES